MKKLKKVLYDEMYKIEIEANGIAILCFTILVGLGLFYLFVDALTAIREMFS